MIVCTVLFVLVSLSSATFLPSPLLHRVPRAAGDCRTFEGTIQADGSNFTMAQTGPCVFYKCSNGSTLPLEYNCLRNGACYPLNSKYTLGCIERTCQLTHGYFDYVLTKEACQGRDQRTCIDVGSTYKDGCFTYRCDKMSMSEFSVSYHLVEVEAGCEYNGQCFPVNHTLNQGCQTVQCQHRFSAIGFFTISNGCEINGQCVGVNQNIVDDCRTLTCAQETLNGLHLLNIKPTKIQCKDADNVCHDSGEWFPLLIDNTDRVNCTCAISGVHFNLTCPSIGFQIIS